MGWDWNVVLAQPGQFHSDCRTIFRKAIGQQEMHAYRDLILEEARNLVPALAGVRGDPYEAIIAFVTLFPNQKARILLTDVIQESWCYRH